MRVAAVVEVMLNTLSSPGDLLCNSDVDVSIVLNDNVSQRGESMNDNDGGEGSECNVNRDDMVEEDVVNANVVAEDRGVDGGIESTDELSEVEIPTHIFYDEELHCDQKITLISKRSLKIAYELVNMSLNQLCKYPLRKH